MFVCVREIERKQVKFSLHFTQIEIRKRKKKEKRGGKNLCMLELSMQPYAVQGNAMFLHTTTTGLSKSMSMYMSIMCMVSILEYEIHNNKSNYEIID